MPAGCGLYGGGGLGGRGGREGGRRGRGVGGRGEKGVGRGDDGEKGGKGKAYAKELMRRVYTLFLLCSRDEKFYNADLNEKKKKKNLGRD